MFKLHLPYRNWGQGYSIQTQIISVETISDVVESIWDWLPELVDQEHIIIEYVKSVKEE